MSGFYKYAEAEPDFVAVVDPDGTEHTAGDLLARANRYVHALRALGLEKGDAVAAVLPNGVLPVEVYLAALQAGWYYVPINYRLSPPEIAYIVQDSGAKAIVSHERYADGDLRSGRGGRAARRGPPRPRLRPRLHRRRGGARRPARHAAPRSGAPVPPCTTPRAPPGGPRA